MSLGLLSNYESSGDEEEEDDKQNKLTISFSKSTPFPAALHPASSINTQNNHFIPRPIELTSAPSDLIPSVPNILELPKSSNSAVEADARHNLSEIPESGASNSSQLSEEELRKGREEEVREEEGAVWGTSSEMYVGPEPQPRENSSTPAFSGVGMYGAQSSVLDPDHVGCVLT